MLERTQYVFVQELIIDIFIFFTQSHISPDTISYNPPCCRNNKAVIFPQEI